MQPPVSSDLYFFLENVVGLKTYDQRLECQHYALLLISANRLQKEPTKQKPRCVW